MKWKKHTSLLYSLSIDLLMDNIVEEYNPVDFNRSMKRLYYNSAPISICEIVYPALQLQV